MKDRINKGFDNDLFSTYIRDVNKHPLLTVEEERALVLKIKDSGDEAAMNKLVVSNLRFVVKVAFQFKQYAKSNQDFMDMIQEGSIGLSEAVKRFESDKGYRLISYGVWYIKAFIQQYISRNWSMVRLPTGETRMALFGKNKGGRSLLPIDLSLDAPLNESIGSASFLDVHPEILEGMDGGVKTAENALLEAEKTVIQQAIFSDILEALQAETLNGKKNRNGTRFRNLAERRLLAEDSLTLEAIGEEWGITREGVRQVELKLLNQIYRLVKAVDSEYADASIG